MKHRGFTLVEMLIVIGLIALLATAVLVAVNPARQFKFARDTERKAHLATLLNAIGQNMAENKGLFTCDGVVTAMPASSSPIGTASSRNFDLEPCLVPEYLAKLPSDPAGGSLYYSISQDAFGHVTLEAESEIDPSVDITITR